MPIKKNNKWTRLGLVCFAACLILVFAWLVLVSNATAQVSLTKRQGPGKGGFKTHDIPAWVVFTDDDPYSLCSDSLEVPHPYIDGEESVSCFIGRREGQFVLKTSNKATSGRMLCLYGDLPPVLCGLDFTVPTCRVAQMVTARIKDGGIDFRFLGDGNATVPLTVDLYDNRQNFWRLNYSGVFVQADDQDDDGASESWIVTTDGGSAVATVTRYNKWKPESCGTVEVSFFLTVSLL